ncbi:Protein dispatched [Dirofilaria immitis]
MISLAQIGETLSTTPVEQSSPTPTQASTTGERKSESTKRSRTKSSGSRRRKKKRETPPEGFDQWPEADQKYYQEISALLRDSKATRKQCSFMRQKIGIWKSLKLRWAYHPTHSSEVSAYKKALKEVIPLGKTENLDIDF